MTAEVERAKEENRAARRERQNRDNARVTVKLSEVREDVRARIEREWDLKEARAAKLREARGADGRSDARGGGFTDADVKSGRVKRNADTDPDKASVTTGPRPVADPRF